jgi:hypothetical protein
MSKSLEFEHFYCEDMLQYLLLLKLYLQTSRCYDTHTQNLIEFETKNFKILFVIKLLVVLLMLLFDLKDY